MIHSWFCPYLISGKILRFFLMFNFFISWWVTRVFFFQQQIWSLLFRAIIVSIMHHFDVYRAISSQKFVRCMVVSQHFMTKCLVLACQWTTKWQKINWTSISQLFCLMSSLSLNAVASRTLRGFVDDISSSLSIALFCLEKYGEFISHVFFVLCRNSHRFVFF